MTLSGGMKRRVMIAKALCPRAADPVSRRAHRRRRCRAAARHVGAGARAARRPASPSSSPRTISRKPRRWPTASASSTRARSSWSRTRPSLMRKLGKKQLTLHLQSRLDAIPAALRRYHLELVDDGSELIYTYDTKGERTGITSLLEDLARAGISFQDLETTQSSLEDIFVSLVRQRHESHAVRAIYLFEMARTWRTLLQSIVSPVISTSLYFVVFGSAIGSRITRGRRRELRRLHRAGADHAVAADPEHLQRLVRHLLSEVRRHHLRAPLRAGLLSSRSCSAMSAPPRPSRSSSGLIILRPPACSCRCTFTIPSGCSASWC